MECMQIDTSKLTPMMTQYLKIKERHKDHLLFFRLGDFYEMFFDDAILASRELELVLTGRDCGLDERAPMCGVPHHACDNYIARLIKKGYKVAICEQTEDPAFAKGVVSREVVRVITPGTLLEDNLLVEDANNFLFCIYMHDKGYGISFADISTGEINLLDIDSPDDNCLMSEIAKYMPKEIVFNAQFVSKPNVAKFLREKIFCTADLLEDEKFEYNNALNVLEKQFSKSIDDLGIIKNSPAVNAAGALIAYLYDTQKVGIERLISLNVLEKDTYMNISSSVRTNLELLESLHTKEKKGSLLGVIDNTKTPMGKRLIKNWIIKPLINPADIEKRLNATEELYKNETVLFNIKDQLSGIFDIERLATRIVYGSANPREYRVLHDAIVKFPLIKNEIKDVNSLLLKNIHSEIDVLEDVRELIHISIDEEPAALLRDGGVIKPGFDSALDELREIMANAKKYLTELENREKEKTGIKSLKIKYNRIFGYFIDITNSYKDLVPENYIRKQTLANSERFFTGELKELEEKIISARERAVEIESVIFEEIRKKIILNLHRIQMSATAIAKLDVIASFAYASLDKKYTRPQINLSDNITVKDGRHPVVEVLLGGMPFVPNDTVLDCAENQIMVITGPNMAGKSTYMRQIAVIVLMAQIGCFVPAASANIGIVDGIFTRIGAADDLSTGQSTFMFEMCEVADILKNATKKSLLILDEIGRGTSTYDGMSIARSVIEYIADTKKLGAKTLFATHYHELTSMENDMANVKNYNIAVKKRGDDITFLRKIVRGGADDSYGIEVSKLAGIPNWIINRAHEVLEDLEKLRPVEAKVKTAKREIANEFQVSFMDSRSEAEEMLIDLDVNTLTPIEALTKLYEIKEKIH